MDGMGCVWTLKTCLEQKKLPASHHLLNSCLVGPDRLGLLPRAEQPARFFFSHWSLRVSRTPLKINMEPPKLLVCRCFSFSNGVCSGSMLVFRGWFPNPSEKYYYSQIGSFQSPRIGGESTKCLSCHHPVLIKVRVLMEEIPNNHLGCIKHWK